MTAAPFFWMSVRRQNMKKAIWRDLNVPLDELRDHLSDLDPSKPVYVLCQSGLRSYLACRILMQHGFDCSHIAGGYLLCQSVFADRAPAQKHRPCGMETAQPADSAQTIS